MGEKNSAKAGGIGFWLQSSRLFSRQGVVKVVGKTLGHYEILAFS